ncbi:MAG: hypothetical protein ACD_58C00069G0001 [uncultured bacterium]|nr:MAG: hypothetical protein ACD_58C00069G0001 [uncultured bacterium]
MDLRRKLRFIFTSQLILAGFLIILSFYNFNQNNVSNINNAVIANNTPSDNTVDNNKVEKSIDINGQSIDAKSAKLVDSSVNNLKKELVINKTLNNIDSPNPKIDQINNTTLVTSQQTNNYLTSNNQNPDNQNSKTSVSDEEVIYHLNAANPNPYISSNSGEDFTLEQGGSLTITFYVKNYNSNANAGDSYIDYSYSSGLSSDSPTTPTGLSGGWQLYGPSRPYPDDHVWDKNRNFILAPYNLYSFNTASFPYSSSQKTFTATFRAKSGYSGSQWIKFRIAMKKSDNSGDYFRYPPSSTPTTDQQGYNVFVINGSIYQNPYLDKTQTTCTNGKYEIGDTFSCSYRVTNPNNSSVTIGLGASIRKIGTSGDGLSDTSNDKTVTINANATTTVYRNYKIPSGAQYGDNEYILAIWSGWPGSSTKIDQINNWKSGININHRPTLSDQTIEPLGSKNLSSNLTFRVKYTDLDDEAPTVKNITVGGNTYPMNQTDWPFDWHYNDGMRYDKSLSASSLGRGTFLISYAFTDGNFSNTTLSDSVTIENRPPTDPYWGSSAVNGNGANLSWWAASDPDGDSITYKVYYGTNQNNLNIYSGCNGITATTCSMSNLLYSQKYYWRVDAVDSYNSATTSSKEIWNFTTPAPPRGDLEVIAQNVSYGLATVPGSNAIIKLYKSDGALAGTDDQIDNVNGKARAYFANLDIGNYYVDVIHTGSPWGWENWGQSNNFSVTARSDNSYIFTRQEPTVKDISFTSVSNGGVLDIDHPLTLGQSAKAVIIIKNNQSNDLSNIWAKVRVGPTQGNFDTSGDSAKFSLSANQEKTFEVTFTPTIVGTFGRDVGLYHDGTTYGLIDGWSWFSGAFKVVQPSARVTQVRTIDSNGNERSVFNPNEFMTFRIYTDHGEDPITAYWRSYTSIGSSYLPLTHVQTITGASNQTSFDWQTWLVNIIAGTYNFTGEVNGTTSTVEYRINQAPYSFNNISPTNDAQSQNVSTTISWQRANDRDGDNIIYDIYRGTDENNLSKVAFVDQTSVGVNPSYEFQYLSNDTNYWWQVKAVDSYGLFSQSEKWKFKTINQLKIENLGLTNYEGGAESNNISIDVVQDRSIRVKTNQAALIKFNNTEFVPVANQENTYECLLSKSDISKWGKSDTGDLNVLPITATSLVNANMQITKNLEIMARDLSFLEVSEIVVGAESSYNYILVRKPGLISELSQLIKSGSVQLENQYLTNPKTGLQFLGKLSDGSEIYARFFRYEEKIGNVVKYSAKTFELSIFPKNTFYHNSLIYDTNINKWLYASRTNRPSNWDYLTRAQKDSFMNVERAEYPYKKVIDLSKAKKIGIISENTNRLEYFDILMQSDDAIAVKVPEMTQGMLDDIENNRNIGNAVNWVADSIEKEIVPNRIGLPKEGITATRPAQSLYNKIRNSDSWTQRLSGEFLSVKFVGEIGLGTVTYVALSAADILSSAKGDSWSRISRSVGEGFVCSAGGALLGGLVAVALVPESFGGSLLVFAATAAGCGGAVYIAGEPAGDLTQSIYRMTFQGRDLEWSFNSMDTRLYDELSRDSTVLEQTSDYIKFSWADPDTNLIHVVYYRPKIKGPDAFVFDNGSIITNPELPLETHLIKVNDREFYIKTLKGWDKVYVANNGDYVRTSASPPLNASEYILSNKPTQTKIGPGQPSYHYFMVNNFNKSNNNEYSVDIDRSKLPNGWTAQVDYANFSLGAYESKIIKLTVTPPSNVSNIETGKVRVTVVEKVCNPPIPTCSFNSFFPMEFITQDDPPPTITSNNGKDIITNNPHYILNGTSISVYNQVLVNNSESDVNYIKTTETWNYTTNLSEGENIISVTGKTSTGVISDTASTIKITLDTIAPSVSSSSQSGTYNIARKINLLSDESEASIYYTTDGSTPTENLAKYSHEIEIAKSTIIKYIAMDIAGNKSEVSTLNININTYQVQLPSKWKMFSVNCEITDLSIFNNIDIRRFNHTTGLYEVVTDKLVPGEGYWIKTTSDLELDLPIGDFDPTQSVAYNQGFGLVSGYFLKYSDQLKFNDGTTTKNLSEAINAGWLKYMAYYYDNDTYNGLDLRSITSNDVLGRSFWLRYYKPITISFNGSWQNPPQRLISEIPKLL